MQSRLISIKFEEVGSHIQELISAIENHHEPTLTFNYRADFDLYIETKDIHLILECLNNRHVTSEEAISRL